MQKAAQDPELAAALKKAGIEVPLPQFIRCEPGMLSSFNCKPFSDQVLAVSADRSHWVVCLSDVQDTVQLFLNTRYDWVFEDEGSLKATPKPKIS